MGCAAQPPRHSQRVCSYVLAPACCVMLIQLPSTCAGAARRMHSTGGGGRHGTLCAGMSFAKSSKSARMGRGTVPAWRPSWLFRVTNSQGDVRRFEDCQRMVGAAGSRFGRLDILVNCAGGWARARLRTPQQTARSMAAGMEPSSAGYHSCKRLNVPRHSPPLQLATSCRLRSSCLPTASARSWRSTRLARSTCA